MHPAHPDTFAMCAHEAQTMYTAQPRYCTLNIDRTFEHSTKINDKSSRCVPQRYVAGNIIYSTIFGPSNAANHEMLQTTRNWYKEIFHQPSHAPSVRMQYPDTRPKTLPRNCHMWIWSSLDLQAVASLRCWAISLQRVVPLKLARKRRSKVWVQVMSGR